MHAGDPTVESTLERVSARAWGVAVGSILGGGLFLATLVLVIKGGEDVGQHLGLLSNVLPGYDVTLAGAFIGFVYAFVLGYAGGRFLAPSKPTRRSADASHLGRHVRIRARAWGSATGIVLGLTLFCATNALLLRGGENVGQNLEQLALYLPGFRVTFVGSLVGALWMYLIGLAVGWSVGGIYNGLTRRAEAH